MPEIMHEVLGALGRVEAKVEAVGARVEHLEGRFDEGEAARRDAQGEHRERMARIEERVSIVAEHLNGTSRAATAAPNGKAAEERAVGRLAVRYLPWALAALGLGGGGMAWLRPPVPSSAPSSASAPLSSPSSASVPASTGPP